MRFHKMIINLFKEAILYRVLIKSFWDFNVISTHWPHWSLLVTFRIGFP